MCVWLKKKIITFYQSPPIFCFKKTVKNAYSKPAPTKGWRMSNSDLQPYVCWWGLLLSPAFLDGTCS